MRSGRASVEEPNAKAGVVARLLGRVAVITGGCAGIGLATAKRFTDEGAKLVIGDVNAEAGAELAAELDATFVAVDVTDPEQVEALFQTAFDTYGSVDIAFNNAEILPLEGGSILDTGLDDWRQVQEANLTSVYLCCKAALRFMLEQKRGSIINTASYLAVLGNADSRIAYTAAKGGVLALSRELGVQFARDGIRVNALCPGPVTSPLAQEIADSDPDGSGAAAGAHPDGPVRRAAGDRLGGGLPRLGRVQLHHRLAVRGGRRHHRRLRHPDLSHPYWYDYLCTTGRDVWRSPQAKHVRICSRSSSRSTTTARRWRSPLGAVTPS